MSNPWLRIPASDYENHMSSPKVAQQQFLAQIFKESLDTNDITTIALLGCATGNGLEYAKRDAIRRITVIDINPEYLEILRQRYEGCIPGLQIVEADLETCELENQTYSLIFAGLVFEYLEPRIVLPKIVNWLSLNGVMITILQLPVKNIDKVSETSYKSLKKLNSMMNLIPPQEFKSMANDAGLQEKKSRTITLETGKIFYIGTYTRG